MVLTAGLVNAFIAKGSSTLTFSALSIKAAWMTRSTLYLILQARTALYWRHFVAPASELEDELGHRQYSSRPPAGLLSSTEAMRLFFLVLVLFWVGTGFLLP